MASQPLLEREDFASRSWTRNV